MAEIQATNIIINNSQVFVLVNKKTRVYLKILWKQKPISILHFNLLTKLMKPGKPLKTDRLTSTEAIEYSLWRATSRINARE